MLSVKDTSISLAFEAEWVAAWDLGGRLYSLWKGGQTCRRGLSGRLLFKPGRHDVGRPLQGRHPAGGPEGHALRTDEHPAGGPEGHALHRDEPRRVPVGGRSADAVVQETADQARLLERSLERDLRAWTDAAGHHPTPEIVTFVERCARFDAEAARADAARFAEVYGTVGILPPDQYLATVLQATEGCSFGTCTFCDLYGGGYRVKPVDEFRRHVAAAREYLGDSALLRARSFFLGAANALAVPTERLLELLDLVPGPFDGPPRPVHAFVDGFTGARKTAADYAELRRRGLGRVYIGLESGHDPLLAFVRKPATRGEAVDAVRAIKGGGASVGVIVMIGLGGRAFAEGHVRDTIAALNDMSLGAGDMLFFSELVEVPGTMYPRAAAEAGTDPLPAEERLAQAEAIRAGLVFDRRPPQVARYDVREFVY